MSPSSQLLQAARYSRYLDRQLAARPWLGAEIDHHLDAPLDANAMAAWLARPALATLPLADRLRRLRALVFCHTLVRDVTGTASLAEVTAAMSALAEVAVSSALSGLGSELAQRHGLPRAADGRVLELVVIGMGKLGGGELNVSSDIDLIFAYPEEGETDGARPLSACEYFAKLGRQLIQMLSEISAEGYVFRVDMRLRPNGDSGPLVGNFDMFENYFITQGREWERYAWIKARALTGGEWAALDQIARPFVFRKYLDYGAIEAMRALHAQIRREVSRRDMADNIKLGPGGIREIEFIAQVFQLIRGGRDVGLQIRPTLKVLEALELRGLLTQEAVAELSAAYDFLRRLEHRIQYLDDAQTHELPANASDRTCLALAMGLPDYAALAEALDGHRSRVSRHFEGIFSDPAAEAHPLDAVWHDNAEAAQCCAQLVQLGYADDGAAAARLTLLRASPRYRSLAESTRMRFDALIPRVLQLCATRPNPDDSLARMLALLEAICRRAAYLALLQQYPRALQRLVELASASSWAAEYVTRHPLLLDEFLDNRSMDEALERRAFATELAARMDALDGDTERQMDVMRELHHAQVFRLLNQDLGGRLKLEALSDRLSELADSVLEETLRQCWARLRERHPAPHRFAVIAYGKLGGKELGYASDLDLVFLYDETDQDAPPLYARLAQRMNTWLASRTPAGVLFETDLRLRPNGESGLLVSSLAAFEKYQRESAWAWEHQALTRARFCAGNPELGARFERLRHTLLCQPRDVAKLVEQVQAMRLKMREAHAGRGAGFDLKQDPGGLIDVEFVVQTLVLAFAHRWPELAQNLGNIALLGLAANAGLLPADIAAAAADAYRELRRAQHALRLNQQPLVVSDGSLDPARAAVLNLWGVFFGEQ